MEKTVLFVVPDGTGIKNYLFSNIINDLVNQNARVVIYHALSSDAISEVEKLHGIDLEVYSLPRYFETKKQKFFREAICYARLLHNTRLVDNDTIMTNWNTKRKGVQKVFYKLVEIYGRVLSTSYKKILKAEEKYQKLLLQSIDEQETFLKEINPSIVFCTHQRALTAIPVIKAAEKLKIETVGAIYSWDNLPKARLAVKTNKYVVWSKYMKNELQEYYPEITSNSIRVTGTPQFEFYSNETLLMSKEDYCAQHGLDSAKKLICFSGDDVKTSPYDHKYLEDVAKAISEIDENERPQVIFRKVPGESSTRYDNVLKKYPFIITVDPKWSFGKEAVWVTAYPMFNDIIELVNLVAHSELVINIGSTMAHDFGMFNKKALYLRYDQDGVNDFNIETIYGYQHFQSMKNLDVIYWLRSKEEIKNTLKEILTGDTFKKISDWTNVIAEHRNKASKNISNYLLDL